MFRDCALGLWFFEVCDLYRRCLFLVLPLLGKDGTANAACLGCLLALVSAAAIREVGPIYQRDKSLMCPFHCSLFCLLLEMFNVSVFELVCGNIYLNF